MSRAMEREERVGNKVQALANAGDKGAERVARAGGRTMIGVERERERARSRMTARAERKWNFDLGMVG